MSRPATLQELSDKLSECLHNSDQMQLHLVSAYICQAMEQIPTSIAATDTKPASVLDTERARLTQFEQSSD